MTETDTDAAGGLPMARTADRTPYLTVTEAAELLQVHPQVVYRLVRENRLRAVRLGDGPKPGIRIPRTALEELETRANDDVRTA